MRTTRSEVTGGRSTPRWQATVMEVKITSTSQCGMPYALATAMIVAVVSAAPAPDDICTSPIRNARSSTKWTVDSSGRAGP